jgi:hypothetical protein
MTIGLVIAALALAAAVVYLIVIDRPTQDDPADVEMGTEQRDYEEPSVASAPAPSVSAAPPKPLVRPKLPLPTSSSTKPRGDDIYDGL